MLSHDSILSSRSLGSPESGKNELEPCHARGSHHFRIRRAARVPLPDRPWKEPEMTSPTGKARTLAEKVWDDHVVRRGEGAEPDLLYIDLHLLHEVTSPQAFDGLRVAGRKIRRPDLTIATEDHNVPTVDIELPIAD